MAAPVHRVAAKSSASTEIRSVSGINLTIEKKCLNKITNEENNTIKEICKNKEK